MGYTERDLIRDINEPPKYDWWIKLNTRKRQSQAGNTENSDNIEPLQAVLNQAHKKSPRLKLNTFHRTLGRDQDPMLVEKIVLSKYEKNLEQHRYENAIRKADSIICKELIEKTNVLVLEIKNKKCMDLIKFGRLIGGETNIAVVEHPKSLRKLRNFMVKKGNKVLWEGKGPRSFPNFKKIRYTREIKNNRDLFFFYSILKKCFDRC